jgi:deoxycytidylate deaminase
MLKLKKLMSQISIVVIRINNKGKLCNSRPCSDCINILTSMNVKYVYYSTDDETISMEKTKHMKKTHYSSMAKKKKLKK